MYRAPHFKAESEKDIIEILQKYSFATLISSQNGEIQVTKMPLLLYLKENSLKQSFFFGHFAKMNPHAHFILKSDEILAVFDGPHHYISPAWYPVKHVPTWNYVSVQIKGRVELIEDKSECLKHLDKMTDFYEGIYKTEFSLTDLPDEKLQANADGIVCFRFEVLDVQSSFKMSQNKNEATLKSVLSGLKEQKSDLAEQSAELIQKLNQL